MPGLHMAIFPVYKLLMLYGVPYNAGLQKQPLRKDVDFNQ